MTQQSLLEKIKADAQVSLKQGDRQLTDILRYLVSILQNEEARSTGDFDDKLALSVLQKEMKKKQEALSMFEKAGRDDLVKEQKKEIEVLSGYLPAMMGEEEVEAVVRKIVDQENGADFGQIMGKAMGELKGKADGQLVSTIVKKVLL